MHLAVECNVAAATWNQELSAIVFLSKQVLQIDPGSFHAVRAKPSHRLLTMRRHFIRSNRGYDLRDINAPLSVKQRHSTPEESLDAPRDNPPSLSRRSASAPKEPLRWPTPRELRARNPLSQNAVRTPRNASAPTGGQGVHS
jgi:uncharacterized protein (DUF2461 family)